MPHNPPTAASEPAFVSTTLIDGVAPEPGSPPASASLPPAGPATTLRRGLTPWRLAFFVLSATTPLAGVVGLMPLSFAFGSGAGVPMAFVAATVMLCVFSLGYIALSREAPGAGSFYSFIAFGFGPVVGLGSAFVALASYACMYVATLVYIGYYVGELMAAILGRPFHWAIGAWIGALIISVLGRRRIELNSGVLATIVVAEFLLVFALDGAIVHRDGLAAFPKESFDLSRLGEGGFGISLMLAFTCYTGFEAAALFSEESVRPQRAVALATYGSVVTIGVLYGVTSWLTAGAIGPALVQAEAQQHVGDLFVRLTSSLLGPAVGQTVGVLMISSLFASALGNHNVLSRYVLVLARQACLPRRLAAVHPVHGSPYKASGVLSIGVLCLLPVLALTGLAPLTGISAAALGIGTLGLIGLQVLTSAAVIAHFRRQPAGGRGWQTSLAPALGLVGLAVVLWLAVSNFGLLTGTDSPIVRRLPLLLLPVFVAGMATVGWIARRRPATYARLLDSARRGDTV